MTHIDDGDTLSHAETLVTEPTMSPLGSLLSTDDSPVTRVDSFPKRLWQVLRRDHLIQIAVAYAIFIVTVAIIGPIFLTNQSQELHINERSVPPFHTDRGWLMFLGSDTLGRSMLARLAVATRTTLEISISAVIVVTIVGTLLGTLVGYAGRWVEAIAMRVTDVLLAFPTLLLALVVLYTLPAGLPSLIFVLSITRVAVFVRVARGETRAVRTRLFVRASRALGARSSHIMFRQILPVIMPTIFVLSTIEFALLILSESALSFLGIGVQPPNITWGSMISEGTNYLANAWWIAVLPGVAIALATISVNLIADWFRKAGAAS